MRIRWTPSLLTGLICILLGALPSVASAQGLECGNCAGTDVSVALEARTPSNQWAASYVLTVTNHGPRVASRVTLRDRLLFDSVTSASGQLRAAVCLEPTHDDLPSRRARSWSERHSHCPVSTGSKNASARHRRCPYTSACIRATVRSRSSQQQASERCHTRSHPRLAVLSDREWMRSARVARMGGSRPYHWPLRLRVRMQRSRCLLLDARHASGKMRRTVPRRPTCDLQ